MDRPNHDLELIGFRSIYQDEPLYRAQLRSNSRSQPPERMGEITRPVMRTNRQRRSLATPGDIYKAFGFQRSTRRQS